MLTPRQQEFCRFVHTYWQRNRISPTLAEIAEGMGMKSSQSAKEHLTLIEKKGYAEYIKNSARSISLTPKWTQLLNRLVDKNTNTMVGVVADDSPELFEGWTESEWASLRSCRGIGGEMTKEEVLKKVENINEDREIKSEIAHILKCKSTRQRLIDFVKKLHTEIDLKQWISSKPE